MNMNRATAAALAIFFAFITLVSVLQISDSVLRTARVDLTATQKYTLSQGTKNTLRTLKEPITLKLFFSEREALNYPRLRVYGARVKDLLREYVYHSDGMLRLEILNVEPASEAEEEAVGLGINPVPAQTGEDIYFALAGFNAVDGQEIIPFFVDEREPYLEYDLTSMISKLNQRRPQKVGLLSSIPLEAGVGGPLAAMQGQAQPLFLFELLRDTFSLVSLSPTVSDIDDDIQLLVIVHPDNLPDNTLYAIDQFVLRGGRVLVFVDPISELAQQMASPEMSAGSPTPASSSMPKLFDAWGIDFDPNEVVTDMGFALQVQTGMAQQPVLDYPVWLGIRSEGLHPQDLIVSDISQLQLGSVGILRQKNGATTRFASLIQSSPNAQINDAAEINASFDPIEFLIDFKPTGEIYTLGARVTGKVESAFPAGRPAEPVASEEDGAASSVELEEKEVERPHLSESQEDVHIIVVADTDLWDDKFWIQRQNFLGQTIGVPTADNGTFVQNAVENLLGSNDLISLRSRGRDSRPLIAVENLRKQAEARYLTKQQSLEQELEVTERRLSELQNRVQEHSVDGQEVGLLTVEEDEEIERFRREYVRIRKELSQVERDLRADIEGLQSLVRFANIFLMPIVVGAGAVGLAIWRERRRRRSRIAIREGVE